MMSVFDFLHRWMGMFFLKGFVVTVIGFGVWSTRFIRFRMNIDPKLEMMSRRYDGVGK